MKVRNVLKYPGSKWRIAKELTSLIPEHHTYLELFFGSGAVFFTKEEISRIEVINDLDSDVVNLFNCIQEDAERLARAVITTPYAREVYDNQFVECKEPADQYSKAAMFLVRCWMGHGYRTNGYKVGWKNDRMVGGLKNLVSRCLHLRHRTVIDWLYMTYITRE